MIIPTVQNLSNEFLLSVVVGIVLIVFFSWLLGFLSGKKRKNKEENQGEFLVRGILAQYCKQSTAHVLNNVTLQCADGTTQIDHILLTQNGILVIETKHYSGWLFANESQKHWTQVIYQIRHKFQNPIFQNFKHVCATQDLLDFLPKEQVRSLVVFTGEAKFKTHIPEGVILVSELAAYIDAIRFASISENRVQFCVGRLECKRLELTEKTDVEHQAYLEKRFKGGWK